MCDLKSNNRIEISNGKVDTDIKVGMDINGNVGVGLKIPVDAVFSLTSNGSIGIGLIG